MNYKSVIYSIGLLVLIQCHILSQQIKFTEIKLPDEIKSINELTVYNGTLYLATAQGLYAYTDTTFIRFFNKENEFAFRINTFCPDKAGNLWFGTYDGHLVKFSDKKTGNIVDIKPYCKTDNFLINSISIDTIVENKNPNVLLSTSGGELFEFDTITQIVRKIERPVKGTIFSIKYGIPPTKWICSSDGFFTLSKNMKWKKNSGNFIVYQIIEDNGKFWGIGRDKDKKAMFMLYYDENGDNTKFSWKEFDLKELGNKYIKFNELAFTSDEIALIVTENGLIRYNPTNASLIIDSQFNGKDLKSLQHIAIGPKGELWLSSSGRMLIKAEIK